MRDKKNIDVKSDEELLKEFLEHKRQINRIKNALYNVIWMIKIEEDDKIYHFEVIENKEYNNKTYDLKKISKKK